MAGRGTDIQLGGNADMRIDAGAAERGARRAPKAAADPRPRSRPSASKVLRRRRPHIIGTERHESRRIDNQLRGRSGRQGDPGRSSSSCRCEDDLMRIFGAERMDGMLQRLGMKEGEAIVHPLAQQGAREGAEEGRGAQLRHPQEPAQVRRRDERPAQGRLRAAPRAHGGRATSPTRSRDMRHQIDRGPGRHARAGEGLRRAVGRRAA